MKKQFVVLLPVLIALAVFLAYWLSRAPETGDVATTDGQSQADSTGKGDATSGAEKGPAKTDGDGGTEAETVKTKKNLPRLTAGTNESVALILAGMKEKKHPERVSAFIDPKPFDKAAFLKDPKTYLVTPEPGRVWQAKPAGPGVRRIRALGVSTMTMKQGGSVKLRVWAEPRMPVTFTSIDLGNFENELTTITVQADERGVAETPFFARKGTIADVNILAACPETSGQVKFLVNVEASEAAE